MSNEANSAYVLSYFGGTPCSESLHLAFSYDGKFWTPLNNNAGILSPTKGFGTGRLRDPYILRTQDNTFVVLATQGWDTDSIYIWDSPNLIDFNNERLIRVNKLSNRAWAPQAIWNPDKSHYIVYWSGNIKGGPNRTYFNTTNDFINFSDQQVLFDPGFDEIDADIQLWNGVYYLYFKDEREACKRILTATSNSPTGPFTVQPGSIVSAYKTEGPCSFRSLMEENKWYMYYDFFDNGGQFGLSSTTNIRDYSGWNAEPQNSFSAPAGVRHGSVVTVSTTELEALKKRWGFNYTQVRWEAFGPSGHYIRHQDSNGRIDASITPFSDSQWNMVRGLADSTGVSFQSTMYSDRYLRHCNGKVSLAHNDDSALFKADATWYKRPGLANHNMVSFESYNYKNQFLRHRDSLLYKEPLSTTVDFCDATFAQR